MSAVIQGRVLSAGPGGVVEFEVLSPADYADARHAQAFGSEVRALAESGRAYIGVVDDIIELDDGASGHVILRDAVVVGERQELHDTADGVRFTAELIQWSVHDGASGIDRRAELGGFKCWLYEVERKKQVGFRAAITPVGGGRCLAVTTSWCSLSEARAAAETALRFHAEQERAAVVASQRRLRPPRQQHADEVEF